MVSFILLGGLLLPGSRCYAPKTGPEGSSGASAGIAPAGPSQTWSIGSRPPQGGWPAAVIAMLQSVPAVWAVLMDPTMTHYGNGNVAGVVVPTISFETIILGRNVTPP